MIGAAWRTGRAPQVALTNPWTYYAKIATVCFAVRGASYWWRQLLLPPLASLHSAQCIGSTTTARRCSPPRAQCRSSGRRHGRVLSCICFPNLLLQLGAGMELFMIKTGFYEK